MSWEAHRWTAKTPAELYHVLGPHGVDELIRQSIASVWRDLPSEGRTFDAAVEVARLVLARNLGVWRKVKQPTPEAFFADLQPHDADAFLRQAMVLTWMMMPRAGGRTVGDVLRIVAAIFDRSLQAWDDDNRTFTAGPKRAGGKRAARAKPKPGGRAKSAAPIKRKGSQVMPTNVKTSAGKSTPSVGSARRAGESEVAPLRAAMQRKLEQAGEERKAKGKDPGRSAK